MRVVVSLSTIPSRVKTLNTVLESLLNQTYPIDLIYINLPHWSKRERCEYPLPEKVDPNRIRILRCEDYGPITKLYPVLAQETDPETLIITVDDDCNYSSDRIETLVRWAKEFPDAAIGGAGITVGRWHNYLGYVRNTSVLTPVSILEGYSGCAYRRKFFQDDLIDYSDAPKEAFYHDDFWISGSLALKGIPRLVHPSPSQGLVRGRFSNGLSDDGFTMSMRAIPVLDYFQRRGVFDEVQTSPLRHTVGFWVALALLIILILLLVGLLYWIIKSPKAPIEIQMYPLTSEGKRVL